MGSWQLAVGGGQLAVGGGEKESAECGVLSEERKWAVGGGSIVGEGEVRILLQNVFYRDVMYQYKA